MRHDGLLHKIIEGRMKGKPTRGRRRIQMLHDLANDGGYVALKWAAEDREGWRHREGCQKPAVQEKTTDDDDDDDAKSSVV